VQHLIVDGRLKVVQSARQVIAGETVFGKQMVQAVGAICPQCNANRAK
jgi:hypothetical protein